MTASLDPASRRYVGAVRDVLTGTLRHRLVGCYLYGSALDGDFLPGRSDIDVIAITGRWLHPEIEQQATERLLALRVPASVKGLDLWLVPASIARDPRLSPSYQVRLLTAIDFVCHDPPWRPGDPRLAMLLAICRSHGAALAGPPPRSVLAPIPRAGLLGGMLEDLGTHAPPHYRVLNACRDQHFLDEGRLCSKLEGAAWALRRMGDPELVSAAVDWQRIGDGEPLEGGRVDAFVEPVAARLRAGADSLRHRWRVPRQSPRPEPRPAWDGDGLPAVSCLMPTYNRRRFAEQAIRLFLRQDYPNRELIIVDDGEDAVGDLVPRDAPIVYRRLERRATIGDKRNLACSLARGEILVQWDDDDWYGPARVSRQVEPIAAGRADLSAIRYSWLVELRAGRFFHCDGWPEPHEGLASGTLAMRMDLWRRCGRYPSASKREDMTMLGRAADLGARVCGIENDGIYVYVRHATNSWRFGRPPTDLPGWRSVTPPDFMPADDLALYRGVLAGGE
jgi:hypothetical protein